MLLVPASLTGLPLVQDVARQFEGLLKDYQQVRDDVAQGLGFYTQLQDAVKTLHKEVGDYSLARSALPCTCMPTLIHTCVCCGRKDVVLDLLASKRIWLMYT